MQARLKLSAPVLTGFALACVVVLFVEHDLVARVLHHAFATGIDIQRDFNRTLAHRLRGVKDGSDPGGLWVALGLAFTYGVVHALGPGHGKFVVTTYFLSHERRVWRGFLMGGQLAVMHVISAIVIVLVAHYLATRMWGPTGDMPGLRTASYASISLVGLYMLWKTRRPRRTRTITTGMHMGRPAADTVTATTVDRGCCPSPSASPRARAQCCC